MKFFNKNSTAGVKAEMSFFDHLDELRAHIFRSAIAISLGAILMWKFDSFFIKNILMGPTHSNFPTYTFLCKISNQLGLGAKLCMDKINVTMQSNTVGGQFGVYFNIVLIGGFIIAFPYVFWQFWKFIKPGLTQKELHNTRGVIFWVSVLFFLGILFGYFVIAPYTIHFFAKFSIDDNIENRWTIASYFNTIVPLILGAGLAFQLPLVMFFLAKIGIVSASFLRRARRYAVLIIFVLAAIITPPDMLSQIICAIPLMILYEISIFLCLKVEKKQKLAEIEEWS